MKLGSGSLQGVSLYSLCIVCIMF